uniref:(S)-2-haloacid dehalogenase n=1 Tax=Candidatus Kentrum sp. DK TaxID=2126562 RepID=A0A450TDW8_9GAMM|nr:MAG: 2-haloacid dehalogenase [Candidatus Kentron sp. DK]VFJ65227.1 MAG: 2-haloacid dehalogenase [Candidatus Kentron sp. DK]
MTAITLAFDVYGTLVDTHGVTVSLEKHVGDSALAFSRLWREKQLEYTSRRALMQRYRPFPVCVADALDFTCASFGRRLAPEEKQALLAGYETLPAFSDSEQGLRRVAKAGHRSFAFSNGAADAVDRVLRHAGIREYFADIVSVDDIASFKPDPVVYGHFLKETGATAASTWLVSANPFDVMGAVSFGMRAVWVRRSPETVFDPWGIEPDRVVGNLAELGDAIATTVSGETGCAAHANFLRL